MTAQHNNKYVLSFLLNTGYLTLLAYTMTDKVYPDDSDSFKVTLVQNIPGAGIDTFNFTYHNVLWLIQAVFGLNILINLIEAFSGIGIPLVVVRLLKMTAYTVTTVILYALVAMCCGVIDYNDLVSVGGFGLVSSCLVMMLINGHTLRQQELMTILILLLIMTMGWLLQTQWRSARMQMVTPPVSTDVNKAWNRSALIWGGNITSAIVASQLLVPVVLAVIKSKNKHIILQYYSDFSTLGIAFIMLAHLHGVFSSLNLLSSVPM